MNEIALPAISTEEPAMAKTNTGVLMLRSAWQAAVHPVGGYPWLRSSERGGLAAPASKSCCVDKGASIISTFSVQQGWPLAPLAHLLPFHHRVQPGRACRDLMLGRRGWSPPLRHRGRMRGGGAGKGGQPVTGGSAKSPQQPFTSFTRSLSHTPQPELSELSHRAAAPLLNHTGWVRPLEGKGRSSNTETHKDEPAEGRRRGQPVSLDDATREQVRSLCARRMLLLLFHYVFCPVLLVYMTCLAS